jgi:hypothetical protein
MEHLEYVTKRALEQASALGYLRGYMNGQLLSGNVTPSEFKFGYEILIRSYELGGDAMDEFDIARYQKRAVELGVEL